MWKLTIIKSCLIINRVKLTIRFNLLENLLVNNGGNMRFFLAKDTKEVNTIAYNLIRAEILRNPKIVLGLATGSTPLGLYKLMIEDCKRGNVSYKDVKTINLDEYIGLPDNHPQSYHTFMYENLFKDINIDLKNTKIPNGNAKDLAKECADYTAYIDKYTPDIQLLGIGSNGHIAFNEPGTSFDATTHVVDLKESTIKDNSRFFDSIDDVPKQAITMGIADIMKAKMIILLATGTSKTDAVYNAVLGPISEDCPASALQLHNNVVVVADPNASFMVRTKGVNPQ